MRRRDEEKEQPAESWLARGSGRGLSPFRK